MVGSENYQIVPWKKFEISYDKLIKAHYKKDKKAREAFDDLLGDFLKELCLDPRPDRTQQQPSPGNSYAEDFEFRKMRWRRLPGLRGAARFGRLLYIVCDSKRLIYPFWIYTHEEFGEPKNQPPSKDLAREILLIQEDTDSKANDADMPDVSVVSIEGEQQ